MKHLRIASMIERRIQEGDYALTGMPAERELADDIGVSRVTLRKALEDLEGKGLLVRAPNRRLVLSSKARDKVGGMQIAFVSPSISPTSFSPDLQLWLAAMENVARQRGDRIRVINYHHWDDPALTESIRAFDGVFLVTSSEPIPAWTAELLTDANSVVALSEDLTHFDMPSIVLFPPRLIISMMQRLQRLGHRRIDCINIQGHNTITQARMDEWGDWLRSEEVGGRLVDEPCGVDENIFEAGVKVARKWIQKIDDQTTAVLCVTLPAAMGVIRAASEAGLSIGDRLSVCTVDCEGIGKFINPPLASFERPDPVEYMNACADWFAGGGTIDNWQGPLLLEPKNLKIFDGGSIGPPTQTK
ncbi:HTH-type transcriptional repressor CytR [Bythopirellula polymerisocia]|uniref:HTH-type transcriptional repressor CytR n=2 Tax=Bythopirellula polymerisocia TaxID=2528003 RepID=A0A5C6CC63_9BACT|nr:HTH-type transcriptional repressor CytR [Bythopirellula polymerisocia]